MDACPVPPLHLANLEELQAEAGRFSHSLVPSAMHATLITLSGELGAGKTSFTQGLAEALGVDESITSPTFVLEKIYDLPEGKRYGRLVHIDAYRLEGETSLVPLGFDDLYADPQNLIVLEWPELVQSQLPKADVSLTLSVSGDGRDISYA
jgi:tRNA threonylcarbamoyladenosine biosynthesis protein TsaE